jgi:hypothetical protein
MARLNERVVTFDYDALQEYDNDCNGLYCLTDRDVAIIVSCLRFTFWEARWVNSEGKKLRDVGREGDLAEAIAYAHDLTNDLLEC